MGRVVLGGAWGDRGPEISAFLGEVSQGRSTQEEGLWGPDCLLGRGLPEGLGLYLAEGPGSPACE